MKEVVERIFEEVRKKGPYEIASGIYLATGDHLIADQKYWFDHDKQKNTVFSPNDFYLHGAGDDGLECVDEEDVEAYLLSWNHGDEEAIIEKYKEVL